MPSISLQGTSPYSHLLGRSEYHLYFKSAIGIGDNVSFQEVFFSPSNNLTTGQYRSCRAELFFLKICFLIQPPVDDSGWC